MKKSSLIIILLIAIGITAVGNQAYAVHLSSSGTGQTNTYTQTQTYTQTTNLDGGISTSSNVDLAITTNPGGNNNISVNPAGTGKIRVDGEKISSKSSGTKKDLTIETEDGTDGTDPGDLILKTTNSGAGQKGGIAISAGATPASPGDGVVAITSDKATVITTGNGADIVLTPSGKVILTGKAISSSKDTLTFETESDAAGNEPGDITIQSTQTGAGAGAASDIILKTVTNGSGDKGGIAISAGATPAAPGNGQVKIDSTGALTLTGGATSAFTVTTTADAPATTLSIQNLSTGNGNDSSNIIIKTDNTGTTLNDDAGDILISTNTAGASGSDDGAIHIYAGADATNSDDGVLTLQAINALNITSDTGAVNITLGGGEADDFIVNTTTLVVESDNSRVGIGTATPGALLHLGAGTTTTAPFRLTDGSLLTTPVDGSLEYESDFDALYFTEGGYREQINKRIASTVAVKSVGTWVAHIATETNAWKDVAWSPELGLFVAVSQDGANRVMTSPNGINWTARSAAGNNDNWQDVTWSPELGLFVAVASAGGDRVMTSPDGTTWTTRAAAEDDDGWKGVTWSPELTLFVAVASTGDDRVMTSPDGTAWTTRAAVGDDDGWQGVAWSPELGLFAAVGNANDRVMTSSDGTTWTARTAVGDNDGWEAITWSPELGLFAAVGTGNDFVMTSPDGTAWTARTAAQNNQWLDVVWSPELGLFSAVSFDGANRVMTSPDGTTWTARVAPFAIVWDGITWSPELGMFSAVASTGANAPNTLKRVMTNTPPVAFPQVYPILFSDECNDDGNCGADTIVNVAFETIGVTVTPTFTGSKTLFVSLRMDINTANAGATFYTVQIDQLGNGTDCGLGNNAANDINFFNHSDDNLRLNSTVQWICIGVPSGTPITVAHNSAGGVVQVDGALLTVLVL